MVALRSRRLESVFGASLDALAPEHVRGLVASAVQEAFDLDFKLTLYGRSDAEKRALAADVAAMANTGGGVIVLGVDEDEHARATATPGVELSDGEVARIRQVVASLVAPMPVFDVLELPESIGGDRGFIVLAVPRSPNAPHAVLVNESLRYPKRNGATTRYLSEPEVATAYRDRHAGAHRQGARAEDVERDAIGRLDITETPWVVVTLVPDLPGDLTLNRDVYVTFQQQLIGQPATIFGNGTVIRRASVGRRRLIADGTMDRSPLARWVLLELHTDGSGAYAVRVPDLAEQLRRAVPPHESDPNYQLVGDESIALGIISGLSKLARYARDTAAAGGTALVRAQLYPISPERPTDIGHTRRFGSREYRSMAGLTRAPEPAEAAAPLDELAAPGRTLVSAAAMLLDELGHAFGVPEMGQLAQDGRIRRRYWDHPQQKPLIAWATEHGIDVTDETLTP